MCAYSYIWFKTPFKMDNHELTRLSKAVRYCCYGLFCIWEMPKNIKSQVTRKL